MGDNLIKKSEKSRLRQTKVNWNQFDLPTGRVRDVNKHVRKGDDSIRTVMP
jgi:hypothetical protein